MKVRYLVFTSLMLAVITSAIGLTNSTYALTANGFNASNIIDDSVFTNSGSMNVAQIQAFLNSKVPVCDTNGTQPSEYGGGTRAQWAANVSLHPINGAFYPPFTCLKDYAENGLGVAQIIYNVAQRYQLNPQVLIVLLQKEQSLVTDTWPSPTQYKTATGYGCPDTSVCDSQYFGLTNQLNWSGKLFRAVLNDSPTWYSPYSLGNNFIQWSPNSSCGGSTVNIRNRSTVALYDYTPYQPNQAAINAGYGSGDSCGAYGNRNFYLYFRDWFGYNSGPAAFKTADSSTIYVPVEGYKLAVPYLAAMQDYGISTGSIQTVSQAYEDSMPTAPVDTGISSVISHVVKSPYDNDEDGGSIYLISLGKRYQFQSIQQLNNFGFQTSDISYLPLSYIYSKVDGGMLSNFVTSPYGSVFNVTTQGKQLYFEYSTYIAQNPSDNVSNLSYYLADKIPSGNPITSRPVLIKYIAGDGVTLYQNNTYYSIANYDVFSCWGFDSTNALPVYRLAQNNYIAAITSPTPLGCIINDGQGNLLLNGTVRLSIPTGYGLSGTVINADLKTLSEKLPTRSTPLKTFLKSSTGSAVWYIVNGKKEVIPNYTSFVLLGLTGASIDTVGQTTVDQLPNNGIKLADGQLVKDTATAAVYTIAGSQRVLYPSSNLFTAYGNSWSNIEAYSPTDLNYSYPFTGSSVSDYLVNTSINKTYLVGQNGCFEVNSTTLAALGTSYATLAAGQSYNSSIFRSLTLNCKPSTAFIQLSGQSLVYWIDAGNKYPLNTYTAMLSKNAGQMPVIMQVTSALVSSLPTGSAFN